MAEPTTISFYSDTEIKAFLDQWAEEEDRSVSWIVNHCIKQERLRRQQANENPAFNPCPSFEEKGEFDNDR